MMPRTETETAARLVAQQETNDLQKRLEAQAKGHDCSVCGRPLWLGWIGGTWKVRCNCYPAEPVWRRKSTRETKAIYDAETGGVVKYDVLTQRPVGIDTKEGEAMLANRPELNQTLAAPPAISTAPMTIEEFDNRMALIEHVAGSMKPQIHYGIIPGTKDKSLWEPGAEYLRAAFNIAWSHEDIEKAEDYAAGTFRYKVRAFQLLGPGVEGPSWTASADSHERKFWCRNNCPRPCDQKHEPAMERAMLPHNVYDRALKRAFVALIRNVTGTSGYFKDAVAAGDSQGLTFRCAEHNQLFRRHENEKGVWYSHRQGERYCNASPALVEQFEAAGQDDGGEPPQDARSAPPGQAQAPTTAPGPEAPQQPPQPTPAGFCEGHQAPMVVSARTKKVGHLVAGQPCFGIPAQAQTEISAPSNEQIEDWVNEVKAALEQAGVDYATWHGGKWWEFAGKPLVKFFRDGGSLKDALALAPGQEKEEVV